MISEVAAVSKEVKTGTETTISCVITGLAATATVEWIDSGTNAAVTGADFTATVGSESSGTQTTTLLVKTGSVSSDKAYTCRVTSGALSDSGPSDTVANLNVYGEVQNPKVLLAFTLLLFIFAGCVQSLRNFEIKCYSTVGLRYNTPKKFC